MTKACSKCKAVKDLGEFYLDKRAKDGYNCSCKECCKAYVKAYRQTPVGRVKHNLANKKYQGEYLWTPERKALALYHSAKKRATERNLDFDLDVEWILHKLKEGCALSKLEFNYSAQGHLQINSPSIDRINPLHGYTKINCRLILQGLNSFKGTNTDNEMIEIMKQVIKHKEQIN